MKKAKRQKSSFIKIGFISVLLVSILSFGFYVRAVIENLKDDPIDNPLPDQTYTVTLDDYKVYQFMDVQYDFIMANITITSNRELTLPQNPFTTSENINLANISEYTNYLSGQGFDLKCPLPASESLMANTYCLFIPVVNRSLNDLILKVNINRIYNISFNINDIAHSGTREMLGIEEPRPDFIATTIDKKLISKRSFYTVNNDGDREEALFSAKSQVFGFQITLENNTTTPIKIESAYLTIDGKGTFQMVDPTFVIDDEISIFGVEISGMKSGYLFMDITDEAIDLYATPNEKIHVLIKLANKNSFIEVLFMGTSQ
ncbi:MAG: hypothetical protein FD133_1184 [Erysipelotrichaceae bacterium]|nr:MAG: hypothetical protein FD179_1589 [Erysipelotrichaceae bacterium]TXT17900.1 MAG: hypothetical protein FD133_1184 [Erysipelotrichaceae bacterium]